MSTVFETIKDRLPITEVLQSYLTLTQAGSQWKAKCPFHNEKTASFSVSPERGLYYCFGCGAKGDIFTFVEQFEGVDKKGALTILADRAGVILTKENTKRESTDPLYELLEATATRYEHELQKNNKVLLYLKSRGLTTETIQSFRIGYAPDEWRFVANTPGLDGAVAERAGLIKKIEKLAGFYDRFRKRIMFPLSDASGRIVGFSGRLYPEEESGDTKAPKYLNSPETELFQKSRILYAFDKAKAHIRKHNFAILVEGQIDVVLAHQAGFKNTVATSGTAVSEISANDPSANLAVLARLTPNVFLAFDGDSAGQKALARAALVALQLGMNPKVVPLKNGTDPADLIVQSGVDAWKALLKKSQHFILHELELLKNSASSPHTLVRLVKERLFPYLSRVISPMERNLYIESISKALSIASTEIKKELELYAKATPEAKEPILQQPCQTDDTVTLEERFAGLLMMIPHAETKAVIEKLDGVFFREKKYVRPEIASDRIPFVMSLTEREYGPLDMLSRVRTMQEMADKLVQVFFDRLRSVYSDDLRRAEHEGRVQDAESLLGILQELNRRRHSG